MRRGIRIALAGTVAAGAVLAGAGTAFAGVGTSPSHHGDDGDQSKNCSARFDKRPPLKESDFPSDTHFEAYQNTTDKDSKDLHGKPYFVHNKFCQGYKDWRHWDDHSYDTFKYDKKTYGKTPNTDPKKNSYLNNSQGYNKNLRKESKNERSLERDHIGAPKNPKSATE